MLRSPRSLEPRLPHHRMAAASLVCALAAALAGCGSADGGRTGGDGPTSRPAKALTIYSDLPVLGPTGATGAQESAA